MFLKKGIKLAIMISIDYNKCLGNSYICICHVWLKVWEIGINKRSTTNVDNCVFYCTCIYICPKRAI